MSGIGAGEESPRAQGAALMKLGRHAEAAAALRDAVEEDPADEAAWRLLGAALSQAGDADRAVAAFERAVALAPDSAKNHYNLALAQQAAGDLYGARTHLDQALALDSNYAQARAALDDLMARHDPDYVPAEPPAPAAPPPPPPPAPPREPDVAAVGGMSRMDDDLVSVGGMGVASHGGETAAAPGTGVPHLAPGVAGTAYAPPPVLGVYAQAENTSGMKGPVPPELAGGWNWGAFWFSWIWLLNHRMVAPGVGLLVLSFIPYVSILGLGAAIYLGIKGNELGWQNRHFASVEDFKECQRIWARWILYLLLPFAVLILLAILLPALLSVRR